MTFNSQANYRIASDVVSQEIDGETILLDMNGEQYFGLNTVGTRIWQLLHRPSSLDALFSIMITEYDVAEVQLREDLSEILSQLIAAGLILEDSSQDG